MNFFIKFITAVIFIGCVDQLFGYMPNQVQALKNSAQNSGKKINCSGCDLRGAELMGLTVPGAFMPNVAMQPCELTDDNKNSPMICIKKQPTNLAGADLSGAVLFSSCLDGVILDKANLTGADLSYVSLEYASLQDAVIKDVVTTGATFCHAVMPDGVVCKESWTGQGVTIDCNCSQEKELQATPAA